MLKSNISILGATGHIGKNLSIYFGKDKNFELFLFARDEKKLEKILTQYESKNNFSIRKYDEFNDSRYDAVINCVGLSNPADIAVAEEEESLETTETFDVLTLEYLKNFPKTKLINFSSGAVYGGQFSSPIKYTTLIDKNFNYMNIKSNYALATIRSEIKHRTLKNLNIIDLRLFSFFSRFINLDAKFLICEMISSIMQNKKFLTDETDIYRDYIHPKDLFSYVKKCICKDSLNDVFDLRSKKPIGKFELLNFLKEKYGLQYEIDSGVKLSNSTGFKRNYYSESRKVESLGHKPEYSSMDTILDELSFII
jgi:nucleoside-diphosphate-sugar epimerase